MNNTHSVIRECREPKHHSRFYYFMWCDVIDPIAKYTGAKWLIEFIQRGKRGYSNNDVYFTELTLLPLLANWMRELQKQQIEMYYVSDSMNRRWNYAIHMLERNGNIFWTEKELKKVFKIIAEDLSSWEV